MYKMHDNAYAKVLGWGDRTRQLSITDTDARVLKVLAWQIKRGVYSLKSSMGRTSSLLNHYSKPEVHPEVAEVVRQLVKEAKEPDLKIQELSSLSLFLYRRLSGLTLLWPHSETWKPGVAERLEGDVIQIVDYTTQFVLIQKDDGQLVTVFLSHADLKEKFNKLAPQLVPGKRIVIERLPNRGRKYNYFVALIPRGSKVI